jgi:chromosome segregation ATPase
LPVTPFEQNCTVIWEAASRRAAVVDPGGDVDAILEALLREKRELQERGTALNAELAAVKEERSGLATQLEAAADKVEQAEYERVVEEAEGLRTRIGELEAAVESRTQEQEKLQKEYDALEQEYLVLYKEKNTNEP